MSEQEYIPTYPTLAFASRADHLAWIAAQEAQPEAAPELLTKAALNGLKLTVKEVDALHEMLLPGNNHSIRGVAKLAEIHAYANSNADAHQDYLVAMQTIRG